MISRKFLYVTIIVGQTLFACFLIRLVESHSEARGSILAPSQTFSRSSSGEKIFEFSV